jgi:hypothetical protein
MQKLLPLTVLLILLPIIAFASEGISLKIDAKYKSADFPTEGIKKFDIFYDAATHSCVFTYVDLEIEKIPNTNQHRYSIYENSIDTDSEFGRKVLSCTGYDNFLNFEIHEGVETCKYSMEYVSNGELSKVDKFDGTCIEDESGKQIVYRYTPFNGELNYMDVAGILQLRGLSKKQ